MPNLSFVKGIPKCFCGPHVLLEAWGAKAKQTHIFKKSLFFGLAAEGGKANTKLFSRTCVCFWHWCARPPNNHLAKREVSSSCAFVFGGRGLRFLEAWGTKANKHCASSVDGGTDLKLAPAGVGFWEVAAEHLMRTDQHQVPNCPSLRPRQFGTGFWSVRIRSPASAGPKPDPEARHY